MDDNSACRLVAAPETTTVRWPILLHTRAVGRTVARTFSVGLAEDGDAEDLGGDDRGEALIEHAETMTELLSKALRHRCTD